MFFGGWRTFRPVFPRYIKERADNATQELAYRFEPLLRLEGCLRCVRKICRAYGIDQYKYDISQFAVGSHLVLL
jgi:hypothetical protein